MQRAARDSTASASSGAQYTGSPQSADVSDAWPSASSASTAASFQPSLKRMKWLGACAVSTAPHAWMSASTPSSERIVARSSAPLCFRFGREGSWAY